MKVKKKESKIRFTIKVDEETAKVISSYLEKSRKEFLMAEDEAAKIEELVSKLDGLIDWLK